MTPTDHERVELRVLRIEIAATVEHLRTLTQQAIRSASVLVAEGHSAADRAELLSLLRVLAHATRIEVGEDAPLLVLGRWSDGRRSGDGLALVSAGSVQVQRLREGAVAELGVCLAGRGCDAGEAAWWLEQEAAGLVSAGEDIGIERGELVRMIVGLRG